MKISAALANITLLGVEAAPFIYFVEKNPNYLDQVRDIFRYVDAGRLQIVTSAITLTEVLVMPIQKNQPHYEREYRDMLSNAANITTVSVSSEIAELAARLRAKYRLRTPDALHVATAIQAGCGAFLTNDFAIQRVTEISVLLLDYLEA